MRICLFNWKDCAHPTAGGAETYTREVLTRWAAAGHQVTWFAGAVDGAPEQERREGVTVVRRGGKLGVYAAARAWYARHGAGRFDLLIDEVNTRPFGCASWAGGTPVVALVHQVAREIWSAEFPPPLSWAGRYLAEPLWLHSLRRTPVLTVSASSSDSLREYGIRDIWLVPEGISRRPRPAIPRQARPTVISVGRLAPVKQVDHAIEAFRRLRRDLPAAQLWIVGDGPQRERLERTAPEGVTFHGRVSDEVRDRLLAESHVLVATSLREGWALVVDEAAAMGVPTIGYDRPGLRDSVPAAGGVLVPPNPRALAATLARKLPGLVAEPAEQGWPGGAVSWDELADRFLATALQAAGLLGRESGTGHAASLEHVSGRQH
ncbi:glycosyltransferase family 4 protein [Streptomyces kaniharaensis]|uniref:Glycosyltransferase family 4 protein n=1 Tax=Streptomyces kaniharaensis TaxID=212423 RepID=A0A6N7KP22_9ACTN|nr:glycosyltransferase family 4 protein [Streptomyces kaniharaensis]MQS12097.1 glycosyltransferase family 4 protein [Streptomyces kaniharaensis]